MDFIDILILIFCAAGLIYFMFDRFKYSNITVFYEKLEKLDEINEIITAIETSIKETDEIIKTSNIDTLYDDELTDKLITYRNIQYILKDLKNEKRKLELYINIANHLNNLGI